MHDLVVDLIFILALDLAPRPVPDVGSYREPELVPALVLPGMPGIYVPSGFFFVSSPALNAE